VTVTPLTPHHLRYLITKLKQLGAITIPGRDESLTQVVSPVSSKLQCFSATCMHDTPEWPRKEGEIFIATNLLLKITKSSNKVDSSEGDH